MFDSSIFKKLEKNDFRVLTGIEIGMRNYQWVLSDTLSSFSRLPTSEVTYRINRLLKFGLIKRTTTPYTGYRIHFGGYDVLALGRLTRRGLSAIGENIGVGKESVVYEGIYDCEPAILKFHRAGYTSFKQVSRQRDTGREHHWIFVAKRAAERERDALATLQNKVRVPGIIDYNRHVVVMTVAHGSELSKTTVDDPDWFLDGIIEQIRKIYAAGFIHADLSEYNVFASPEGVEIIDWPGYVTTIHPDAKFLLTRDVGNVLTFFNRKYGVVRECDEVVDYVKCCNGQSNHKHTATDAHTT
uniref:non-specific serine/threonine protein kinase n=1 Tax=Candidatus Methanogaster sp. ANME-2c ERB4 TaxID=2759911 RepID=A0A7G9YDQ6_9EURY|nr:RIO-type serine/threonine-protein kinase Rio2 [Methanosarcinales archaeon ANME-2c ERB4]